MIGAWKLGITFIAIIGRMKKLLIRWLALCQDPLGLQPGNLNRR